MYFACMLFCVEDACLVPTEARKWCQVLWTGSYVHGCELLCGCRDSNPGPLEEEQVLFTAQPSLQLLFCF